VKREAAKKAGALAVVDGRAADAVQQIQKHCPDGVWAVIDLVGSSDTVKLAVDSVTKGGKIVVVGLFGGDITIPTPYIPMRALNLQGSYVGSPTELKELIELVHKAKPPQIPITRRPLPEAYQCLTELKAGKLVGRAVLVPAG
jgi:D-arabinose 1-dehydrogenase-like Zn-dependent alcohol dehydrogenase